jgi:hypothetical protein
MFPPATPPQAEPAPIAELMADAVQGIEPETVLDPEDRGQPSRDTSRLLQGPNSSMSAHSVRAFIALVTVQRLLAVYRRY